MADPAGNPTPASGHRRHQSAMISGSVVASRKPWLVSGFCRWRREIPATRKRHNGAPRTPALLIGSKIGYNPSDIPFRPSAACHPLAAIILQKWRFCGDAGRKIAIFEIGHQIGQTLTAPASCAPNWLRKMPVVSI
jgi:hypothetical protein